MGSLGYWGLLLDLKAGGDWCCGGSQNTVMAHTGPKATEEDV